VSESKKGQGRIGPLKNTMKKFSNPLSGDDVSREGKVNEHQREIEKLHVQIKSMEEELRELYQSRGQLDQAYKQNERSGMIIPLSPFHMTLRGLVKFLRN